MFPEESRTTSLGPHKPASVAGPPSPSCSPPSPTTVFKVAASSGLLAPPPPSTPGQEDKCYHHPQLGRTHSKVHRLFSFRYLSDATDVAYTREVKQHITQFAYSLGSLV